MSDDDDVWKPDCQYHCKKTANGADDTDIGECGIRCSAGKSGHAGEHYCHKHGKF